ncbi:MAG TPA: ATP-binding cassette domain-containing protein, partial [Thermoanaerobaculia bacterium]
MLDVALRNAFNFALRDVTLLFRKSTHTAIVGPAGCGASTLLRVVSGHLKLARGEIIIGSRVANAIKPAARPLLYATSALEVPGRWSVQHALVAAVRQRTLDRVDRQHEYELAVEQWGLRALVERRVDSLSSSEQTLVQLARIELLRPGVVVIDRVLERMNPAELPRVADRFYRMLRIIGATVISAPASRIELGLTDTVVVLDHGRVVQEASVAELYADPSTEAVAAATGDVNVVPVTIRGNVVESVIGAWDVAHPPFSGSGIALIRPDDFSVPPPGEDSDLIF